MCISYMKSCAADAFAINRLLIACFGENVKRCADNQLEGRYVLAFDKHKLVGMLSICDNDTYCVLPEYECFGVSQGLISRTGFVRQKIAAMYNLCNVVA